MCISKHSVRVVPVLVLFDVVYIIYILELLFSITVWSDFRNIQFTGTATFAPSRFRLGHNNSIINLNGKKSLRIGTCLKMHLLGNVWGIANCFHEIELSATFVSVHED